MDANRKLAVTLQNLASKAREAVALDEIPRLQAALIRAQAAALCAVLDDAKKRADKAARVSAGRTKPTKGR